MESKFYVVIESHESVRAAHVCTKEEYIDMCKKYDGYFIIKSFSNKKDAKSFCKHYNDYKDDTRVYVIDKITSDKRKAFLASPKTTDRLMDGCFDDYDIIAVFDNKKSAKKFRKLYNNYKDDEIDPKDYYLANINEWGDPIEDDLDDDWSDSDDVWD